MLVALIIRTYLAIRGWYDRPWFHENIGNIKFLPFDLVLKIGKDTVAAEFDTVNFIRSNTTIPVPRVIASDIAFGRTYMLMRKVEGVPLDFAWPNLDTKQRANVVEQLRSFVAQLRTLSPTLSRGPSVRAVCGLNNAPIRDSRISSSTPAGPFPDERAFNDHLIAAAERFIDISILSEIRSRMRDDHRIYFTHGDLAPRNIFVQGDVVTAVIDWEESGWYPEHWEMVKARWCTLQDPEWLHGVHRFVGDEYERDWMIDREMSDHMVGAF